MTREEAINIYQGLINPRIKEAFEFFAPELAESEDERIRKGLIKLLTVASEAYLVESTGIKKDSYLAYLEKQKYDRMKPVYDARESFESALEKAWNDYHNGYENVDKLEDDYVECAHAKGFREGYLFGIEKQKEQKPADYDHEMWKNCEVNFEGGKKEVINNPEKYGLTKQKPISSCDIVPYIDDKIAALQDMWREEKVAFDWDDMKDMIEDVARHFYHKEQKPDTRTADDLQLFGFIYDLLASLDWREDYAMSRDECLRRLNDYRPQKPADLPAGFYVTFPDGRKYYTKEMRCNGMNVKVVEPKPAEWSDTDTIGWDEAFACVTRAEKAAKNEEELQNAVTAEKWLKEIKFKYYVHPVKQGWSEEERDRVAQYLHDRDGGMLWSKATEITNDILDILRPQPHWKPSEHQMNILKAVKEYVGRGSGYWRETLGSLIEDLEKL